MNYLQQLGIMGKLGTKGTEYLLPFESIVAIDSENIRDEYGNLEGEDLESIKDGIKLPLIGFISDDDGLFHVCDGFRRYKKYSLLIERGEIKAGKIPCKIDPDCATVEGRTLLALNTASGKQLSIPEQGKGYIKLRDEGLTIDEIAQKVGRSKQHINNAISLIEETSEEIQQLVEEGKVSATTVIETLQSHPDNLSDIITEAVEVAKSEGKKRATAKHIAKVKPIKEEPKQEQEQEPETEIELTGEWLEETEELETSGSGETSDLDEIQNLAEILANATKEDWMTLSLKELQRISKSLYR